MDKRKRERMGRSLDTYSKYFIGLAVRAEYVKHDKTGTWFKLSLGSGVTHTIWLPGTSLECETVMDEYAPFLPFIYPEGITPV